MEAESNLGVHAGLSLDFAPFRLDEGHHPDALWEALKQVPGHDRTRRRLGNGRSAQGAPRDKGKGQLPNQPSRNPNTLTRLPFSSAYTARGS